MLYDQAQLLSSVCELSLLLPPGDTDRTTLHSMAHSIITYISRDLRSPEGAFYSAEDADSLPTHGSKVKKEGAFYVWTAAELDKILGEDSKVFKFHFGVKQGGNCDPKHDIQGELKGQVRPFLSTCAPNLLKIVLSECPVHCTFSRRNSCKLRKLC